MASLELVLGMPFLLLVVATAWSIVMTGLGQQVASIEARHHGWSMRTATGGTPAQVHSATRTSSPQPLTSLDPNSDILIAMTERSVGVAGWLGGSVVARGRVAVTIGTWDHRDVPEMNNAGPHIFLFPRLALQGISGIQANAQGLVQSFVDLFRGFFG